MGMRGNTVGTWARRSGARAVRWPLAAIACAGWLVASAAPATAQAQPRDGDRAPKRAEVRVQRPAASPQVEWRAPDVRGRDRAVARPGAAEVRVRDVGVRVRDVPVAEVRRAGTRGDAVPRAEPQRWEVRDAGLWAAWPRGAEPAGPAGPRGEERRLRPDGRRWAYGGYGPVWHGPYGERWTWRWWYDPYWHGHDHVFVFRHGHRHRHRHHRGFGHHHGLHLHHGFFHDFWFHHHGHLHFVIVIVESPRVVYVPVYEPPVGWVVETRELPVLVRARVPGAVYESGSCARLEIVTAEGQAWSFAVDPADFGAENVGELQDAIEEALVARGELDVEDLSGVRHVIPRESIREIRGGPCRVD